MPQTVTIIKIDHQHVQELFYVTFKLFLYRLLPESIPWLVSQRKYKRLEQVVSCAAQINKIDLPESLYHQNESAVTQVTCDTVLGYYKTLIFGHFILMQWQSRAKSAKTKLCQYSVINKCI